MCAVKLYMFFKNIVLFEASVSVNYQKININQLARDTHIYISEIFYKGWQLWLLMVVTAGSVRFQDRKLGESCSSDGDKDLKPNIDDSQITSSSSLVDSGHCFIF